MFLQLWCWLLWRRVPVRRLACMSIRFSRGSVTQPRTLGHLRFLVRARLRGYYNITHGPGMKFGVDVRDTTVHSNNASLNVFSLGGRLEGTPLAGGIRPYAQIAAGLATSKAQQTQVHTNRGMFGIFAGIDYPLNRHVDFRIVELGYG